MAGSVVVLCGLWCMGLTVWLRTRRPGVRVPQGVQNKKATFAGGFFVWNCGDIVPKVAVFCFWHAIPCTILLCVHAERMV